jgi:hypothetical protein
MSLNGPTERTARANRGRPDGGFLGLLRAVALIAAAAAGCASVALLLRAGPRQKSHLLIVLFTIWVLSPFMALLWANVVSRRWSDVTRAVLYGVTLVVALGSLAIYGDVVDVRPAGSPNAFFFVIVPPVSWLFMTIAVSMATFVSRRRSRRGDGSSETESPAP